ncbi:hypothetical protein DOY81_004964 [Sarcophaga bullata]|nr:hypothetical protein DOY81_004964 [Sarcophaga bullata]
MFGKQNLIFLLLAASCFITTVMASKVRKFSTKKFNENLLNLMARSSNSFNYPECFKHYAPIINNLLDKYERDHEACCTKADNERNELDEKTLLSRQRLANETDESCALLYDCSHAKSIDDEYNCYVTGGNTNSKTMREISNGATLDWAAFKEQKRVVTYNEEECIYKTKVCFDKESDKVYEQLNNCLAGLTPTPITSSTTVKVSSTSTTTKTTPTESTTTKPTPTESTTTRSTSTKSTTTKPTGSSTTKSTPTGSTTTATSTTNLFVALFAFLGISMAVSVDLGIQHKNSLNLLTYMTRSSNVLQRNPARSLDCFDYYVPLLTEITEKYEREFKACKEATDGKKASAESETLEQRNDLARRSSDSCSVLSQCSDSGSAKDVFECFAIGGSDSQVIMHSINSDAIQHLADLNRQLLLIDLDDEKCTNTTKNTYEKESAKAYSDMTSCLSGLTEVPKPTDPPATDAPATDPPATNAPATDPPATDAPATDPPATDAPSTEDPEPAPEDRLPEEDIYMLRKALEAHAVVGSTMVGCGSGEGCSGAIVGGVILLAASFIEETLHGTCLVGSSNCWKLLVT